MSDLVFCSRCYFEHEDNDMLCPACVHDLVKDTQIGYESQVPIVRSAIKLCEARKRGDNIEEELENLDKTLYCGCANGLGFRHGGNVLAVGDSCAECRKPLRKK